MDQLLGQVLVDAALQERFAQASGDWNPVHMDPLAARRTQTGGQVLHGMNGALLCLDFFAKHDPHARLCSKINISFSNPVYVGETISFEIDRREGDKIHLATRVNGTTVTTIKLAFDPSADFPALPLAEKAQNHIPRQKPVDQSFAQLEQTVGIDNGYPLCRAASALFPDASRWLGSARVAALAALSPVVGMKCPGLHSLFLGADIGLTPVAPEAKLTYTLRSADNRFRRLGIRVAGGGIDGTVAALVRMPPQDQQSLTEMSKQIAPDFFAGQNALIIGGSRGLGECTAKAIAAGGGTVTLSYAVGSAEAQALVKEIKAFGGQADMLPYDALKDAEEQLERLTTTPSHVYYFATKPIRSRDATQFDKGLFQDYCRFYVEGFYNLCRALSKKKIPMKIFYPSTVYIGERPCGMAEYVMAKAAGEILCVDIKRFFRELDVTCERLPRVKTDQTATTMPDESSGAFEVMLPILRKMQQQ
ncbi:MAG: SDR family NAD(P)-dependent oxidoreductase [Bdellovibrionales bacterium]